MSIEPDRDQFFQYGTFGVIGVTLVVCLCYGLIFLNPRLNFITPLQPIVPTATVAALVLPATWTPTLTNTPTRTPTEEPTQTPTATLTDTPVPTNTALPSATLRPPPPATSRPPGPPPPPPAATQPPPSATPPPATRFVAIKGEHRPNCNEWSVSGTVWAHGYGNGFATGTFVRLWVNGQVVSTAAAGTGVFGNVSPGYYEFGFKKASSGSGKIGIVDGAGNLLSPQYDLHLDKSCTHAGDWNEITVDFAYAS